ncbi:CotH kinase family protein [Polaribacter filamentus]|uniref:CotH kinase family protein n=1 Tax=Polaribacter filamentus TaxID=53483 RepID=UPI000CF2D460|nr:CotH kinase family protein [Polaribacter filamentus]
MGLFIFSTYNLTAQDVRINEVVSSNSMYTDEDGDTPDWLEIHNFGTEDVLINGWTLSDDINNLSKWKFPNYTLSANEYLLLWASDKDRSSISYPRTLVNQGDEFKYLIPTSQPDGNWNGLNFDDSNWTSGSSGFGYADGDDATIIPNGTQSIYLRKTFVISNLATISSLILDMDYDDAFVAYINENEVARANITGTPPAYNSGTITDREAQIYSGGRPERFMITDFNSILNEGENILTIQAHNISAGSSDFTLIPFLSAIFSTPNNSGIAPPAILGLKKNNLHTNFKISASSEIVRLTNASGVTLSQITAENLPENTSVGISKTSGAIVSYIETTPGLENSTQEYLGSVQSQVVFSNQGGLIDAPISLRLSGNTSEEVIRYTINENNPTETSALYTGPIQINEDTTVRAQIFLDTYIPSSVTTKTYILNTSNLTFTDSNLPIVIINTENGAEIPDEPKILGTMKIIQRPNGERNFVSDASNEAFLNYSGTIGIETRGSSSQALPKKPYGIDTLKDDGITDKNVELLGMPKENDWILNSFAFDDSMMRDYISYTMARQMGQYAVNLKYCEVILNGDYIGLYALSEKIKVDGDRVNIAKLADDENSYPEVTGGYLMQTDRPSDEDPEAWYNNGAGYIHEKPNADDITPTQAAYIETVFRALDQTAGNADIRKGYPAVIDVPSFVDYMLVAEIASNVDAYALSTYYHKDRGGKLRAGPVWDYNLTFGNDLFDWGYDRSFTDVWQYQYSNVGANFWGDLFEDATFKCYASKRFNEVTATGGPLNYDYIVGLIDTTVAYIAEAVVRENQRWNTIEDFSSEIATMKTWLQERIVWMKNNLGQFSSCSAVATPSLVITKIHYNPQETTEFPESDDQEFIEIKNTGSTSVALTGIYLIKLGVSYQFPQNATLAGGASVYLAGNATVFEQKYGFAPFDTFLRDLSNKSHHLVLADAFGNLIDHVEYADGAPWPEEADGGGFYLELINVLADNSIASNWKASADGVLSTTDFNTLPVDFSVYPNPTAAELHINAARILEKIEIYNLLGQQIKTVQVNLKSVALNISDLKKGMYLLNLKFIDGTRATTKIFKK